MPPTVVIGLDGADFTVLDSLVADGAMPFLGSLMDQGCRADLRSTAHPLTPPAWVTFATGRSPGNHGVFDFVRGEDRGNHAYFTLYNSMDVRCEPFWSIATRAGRRAAALNFVMTAPVTFPCRVVIPGMTQWKHLRRNTHPPGLHRELKAFPWFDPKTLCWDFDHIAMAVSASRPVDRTDWVRSQIERERQWFQVMRHVMRRERLDLAAIVFDGVDKLQHLCWECLDPACFPTRRDARWRNLRSLCVDYFRELDGLIRAIADLAGKEARLFLASDHGFGPTRTSFRVNQFLRDRGDLFWKETAGGAGSRNELRLDLDWSRTVAYCPTRSSNGIFIRVASSPGAPGVRPEAYETFRRRLADDLMSVLDPDTGEPVVARTLFRETTFPGPACGLAPDLTLVLRDHGFVLTAEGNAVVERKPRVMGTHYPMGVFIAAGPGLRRGYRLPNPVDMVDMAPTLLHGLGLSVPGNLEGRVLTEMFEAAYRREHPVEIGANAAEEIDGNPGSPPAGPQTTASGEQRAVLDQLRALGYID